MKVSIFWLRELVNLKVTIDELIRLIPLRTVGTKEITKDFIELDMKGYNRADLLSLRGVAYEMAAITDSKVKFRQPDETKYLWVEESFPKLEVAVEDDQLTPVYCLAKIEGLTVQPSNQDWVKKLADSGYRAVNNVADVTNLVMLEYGQPLHAFDARAVKEENIIVRVARKGERITTLDGKTRDLSDSDLLITDPQNALGIAGVMGGKDSEISDSTSTILLEAAIFDPVSIRKTTARLKLQSEASKRFYHGLTKKRLLQALDAAIRMYQQLGGRLTAITLTGNLNDQPKTIKLTQEKINSLIGVDIPPQQVESSLQSLGFQPGVVNLKSWQVIPPYWRSDVHIEEDLIEEIARMYGYEKIPAKKLPAQTPPRIDQRLFEFIYNLKKILVDLGLTEVQTYSFYSTDVLNNLDIDKKQLIKIANPISSETEYLRNEIWPNLVEVIGKNYRQGFKNIAIFEIGKIYWINEKNKIREKYSLAAALMNGSDNPLSELYRIVKDVVTKLGLEVESKTKKEVTSKIFHPKKLIDIFYKGKQIGELGEAHKRVTDNFGIPQRVAAIEFNLRDITKFQGV